MNENGSKCPDPETLSAFFDRETNLSADIKAHIDVCAICKKRLDDYDAMSNALKKRLSSAVSDSLENRIKALVHERIEREQSKPSLIPFKPLALRIAAILVIGCGLSVYFIGRMLHVTKKRPVVAAATETRASSDSNYAPINTGASGNINPGGTVFLSNLEPVSLGNHPSTMNVSAETERSLRTRPASISNRVHHVWVAHNLAKVESELDEFAKQHHIPANKMKLVDTDDKVKLNIRLSKRNLVGLIQLCSRSGLELLSPQSPQPEQKEFVGDGDDLVQYNADFVLNNH